MGRESAWIHVHVYVGNRFQWVMGGGYGSYFGCVKLFCLEVASVNVLVEGLGL